MKSFKVCTFYLALLLSSSQRMAQYWHVKQTRTVTISNNITVVKPEEEKDHLRDLDFDEGKITSANLNLKYRLLGCKLDSTQHMIKSSDGSFLTLKIKLRDSWKAPITVLREFTDQKKNNRLGWIIRLNDNDFKLVLSVIFIRAFFHCHNAQHTTAHDVSETAGFYLQIE